jgi:hypothetical protein
MLILFSLTNATAFANEQIPDEITESMICVNVETATFPYDRINNKIRTVIDNSDVTIYYFEHGNMSEIASIVAKYDRDILGFIKNNFYVANINLGSVIVKIYSTYEFSEEQLLLLETYNVQDTLNDTIESVESVEITETMPASSCTGISTPLLIAILIVILIIIRFVININERRRIK